MFFCTTVWQYRQQYVIIRYYDGFLSILFGYYTVQLIWMKTKLSTFLSMFIFCHRVFHSMLSIMHKTASTPADLYQGHTNVMYFVVYSTCYQFLPQQNQSIRLQVYVNLLQRCHIYIVSFIVVFSLAKMIRLFPEICDAVVLQILKDLWATATE